MMRAKKKLTKEKKTYEELKAQRCVQHTVRSTGTHLPGNRYSASQCNMFDKLLWLECSYIAKAVWLSMCSFHVNRLQSLELQEKVEALLRKNPPPSSEERQVHHVMSCHNMPQQAYQPYQLIRHSVEAMVGSHEEVWTWANIFGDDRFAASARRSWRPWRSCKGGKLPTKTWRSVRIKNVPESSTCKSKDSKNTEKHRRFTTIKKPGKAFCMFLVLTKGFWIGNYDELCMRHCEPY